MNIAEESLVMNVAPRFCDFCDRELCSTAYVPKYYTRAICLACARAAVALVLSATPGTTPAEMAAALGLHECGSVSGGGWGDSDPRWRARVYADQRCLKCGHAPCPCCECWCDVLLSDGGHNLDGDQQERDHDVHGLDEAIRDGEDDSEGDLCCDGECSYASEPRLWWVAVVPPEEVELSPPPPKASPLPPKALALVREYAERIREEEKKYERDCYPIWKAAQILGELAEIEAALGEPLEDRPRWVLASWFLPEAGKPVAISSADGLRLTSGRYDAECGAFLDCDGEVVEFAARWSSLRSLGWWSRPDPDWAAVKPGGK